MFYAYVLKSKSLHRLYKGACQNLTSRLKEHNLGKTKSTKAYIPWEVAYYETFDSFADAREREKYFKTAAGRRFLKKKIQ